MKALLCPKAQALVHCLFFKCVHVWKCFFVQRLKHLFIVFLCVHLSKSSVEWTHLPKICSNKKRFSWVLKLAYASLFRSQACMEQAFLVFSGIYHIIISTKQWIHFQLSTSVSSYFLQCHYTHASLKIEAYEHLYS